MRADIDSPFSPGQIVDPDRFVGRQQELATLEDRIRSVSRGSSHIAFITGQRGIGKSSLARKARQVAGEKYNFITIQTFLSTSQTEQQVVKLIFEALLNESKRHNWFHMVKSFFGNSVEKIDLFGLKFEFRPKPEELETLTRQFGLAISNFFQTIQKKVGGLFIVLDDINGLADRPEFANWLKVVVDGLRATTPLPRVFFLLVGLDGRRERLLANQPSLDRLLNVHRIDAWDAEESEFFFFSTLQESGVECTQEAARFMASFSGGFPVMAHEIGDAVFYQWRKSDETNVNKELAIVGLVVAAQVIGRKYFDDQFYGTIRSKRYMNVVKAISECSEGIFFSRQDCLKKLPVKERSSFDSFVKKMKGMGFFKSTERGEYRWVNPMHAVYCMLFHVDDEQNPDLVNNVAELVRLKKGADDLSMPSLHGRLVRQWLSSRVIGSAERVAERATLRWSGPTPDR